MKPGSPFKQTLTACAVNCISRSRMRNQRSQSAFSRAAASSGNCWSMPPRNSSPAAHKFALPSNAEPDDALRIFIDASVIECLHRRPRSAHQPRLRPGARQNRTPDRSDNRIKPRAQTMAARGHLARPLDDLTISGPSRTRSVIVGEAPFPVSRGPSNAPGPSRFSRCLQLAPASRLPCFPEFSTRSRLRHRNRQTPISQSHRRSRRK